MSVSAIQIYLWDGSPSTLSLVALPQLQYDGAVHHSGLPLTSADESRSMRRLGVLADGLAWTRGAARMSSTWQCGAECSCPRAMHLEAVNGSLKGVPMQGGGRGTS